MSHIDHLIKEFHLDKLAHQPALEEKPITIWLPVEYKMRFDELQGETKKRFGKMLKEVIKHSIDKVEKKKAG